MWLLTLTCMSFDLTLQELLPQEARSPPRAPVVFSPLSCLSFSSMTSRCNGKYMGLWQWNVHALHIECPFDWDRPEHMALSTAVHLLVLSIHDDMSSLFDHQLTLPVSSSVDVLEFSRYCSSVIHTMSIHLSSSMIMCTVYWLVYRPCVLF